MNLIKNVNNRGVCSKTEIIGEYEVEVMRKNVKNIRLAVYPPDAALKLSVPKYVSDDTIKNFVLSKSEWIKKTEREDIIAPLDR